MLKENILIVDDEQDILELLEYNLSREGYNIFEAKTGEEALKLANAKLPDLIILDLMLTSVKVYLDRMCTLLHLNNV